MKLWDLEAQQELIEEELRRRIDAVLEHGQYIMGPEVQELEARLSSLVRVRHAIGCASGTDGLLMALMAFDVGPGDIVLTTPFTFVSTAEVIKLLGATPVFVDIRPDTFNVDPEKIGPVLDRLSPEERKRIRGLIAVDLFGLPADYDALREVLGDEHFIIEDAAQSFGASYKSRPAGSLADVGVTSFFPAKPLGCYGDGGAVFTSDDHLADKLRSIRIHGKGESKYENVRVGINGRLDTIQAAVLLAKLEVFEQETLRREQIAQLYSNNIDNAVRLPTVPNVCTSAWASYPIVAGSRSSLLDTLTSYDIPTAIYYPTPLHLQTVFADGSIPRNPLLVAEQTAQGIINLPVHPYLQDHEIMKVVEVINDWQC